MFNVTIVGNLGADAEVRQTQGGTAVCGFRVGASTGFGERKKTEWVQCSKWGKGAENLANYLTKGTKVVVTGQFSTREWTGNDGTTKTSLEINVSELEFASNKQAGQSGQGGQARPEGPPPPSGPHRPSFDFDDDISF